MNSEFFDLVLEGGAMWVKSQISKSEMHPADKAMLNTVTDIGKAVFSEMNHRAETQRFFQNREKLIALARICDIDRLELIQLNEYMDESIFLVLGGDYSQFF